MWKIAGMIGALTFALPAAAQDKTSFTLEDFHRLAELSEPAFADGAIYYTVSTHNLDADKTVSDIWRVPYKGGDAVNLTNTPDASEQSPQASEDGSVVAYLSNAGPKEETQIWVKSGEREARPETNIRGGVSEFALSADGRRILFTAEIGAAVAPPEDRPAPPVVIDRLQFKEDGRGYLDDRRLHLFTAIIGGAGAPQQLTSGDFDHWAPGWSPDGALISFVSKRRGDPDRNFDFDVYVMAATPTATPRGLGDFKSADNDPGWGSRPAWSSDGKSLAWLRSDEDKWIYYAPTTLAIADVASGVVRDIAPDADKWFTKPQWSPDGKSLYALMEGDRVTHLVRIDLSSGNIEEITSGKRFAADFVLGPKGEIAVLDGDQAQPYQLRSVSAAPRPLTHHNDWLKKRRLADTREIYAKSGGVEIHGLLVTPPGHNHAAPLPLIVRVHGGPVYQFSHEFMSDWQYFAAAGYAVLGVNPRGSSGRGFDFARAIYADWGDKDVKDVLAVIDETVDTGVADKDRIGVGGWSYGGILTDYLIASDTRFKAAVSGAGMANFLAGYGADQYIREYENELGSPWRDDRKWRRVSYAFFESDKIETPTLFVCAGADFNVPCIGGEQMFQALRSNGVEARLVVYPEENHGLTVPSYLADRLQRALDWYDARLK